MTYTTPERLAARQASILEQRELNIIGWLEYVHDLYSDLISRPSETSSISGFDSWPEVKPCEHRLEWYRHRLCLACDNTGWRRLTAQEKRDNLGIDPYAADVKRDVALTETDSSRKTRAAERLDTIIAYLMREETVRDGTEAPETVEMRNYRIVAHKHSTLRRILWTLTQLRTQEDALYRRLDQDTLIKLLARLVPGQIHPAPLLY